MRAARFRKSFPMLAVPLFVCLFTVQNTQAAERFVVQKLKDLCLTTSLVGSSTPRTVIVAPTDGRYDAAVALVQARLSALSGVSLPVYRDVEVTEELLRNQNVIAFGNMATNVFIERLYRQWQVILDLKYPGPGGFVVRTLHNPFGTGHNVIFIGGSDDAGVAEAAKVFTDELKGNSTALSVGWLMKIRIGKGLTPPIIGSYLQKWDVKSWSDSRRMASDGTTTGYYPATFFGWNQISIAGVLYYMTGQKEYLQTFKEVAMPDPQRIPLANKVDDAFTDPANPLVKNYHYRAHLVDCVYDLIEESPLFTDKERLFITNKLLDHQREYDPNNTYSVPNGDRHALWHMLNIYTGSRYFDTYYPDPAWKQRIANVRKGFRSLINNPTWGERDTLEWVATSIEPVFEFILLDGSEEFVDSGTMRTFMNGLEVLMTGEEVDDYNRYLPLSLLFKADYLLKDNRYLWMAEQLGADTSAFRIGQSYWPRNDGGAVPPTDLVGRITVAPLAGTDREKARTPVPAKEGFQLLSYRTGLKKTDDYLLLDGFEGLGRHPYQLNTLIRLRMFGGKYVLSGYANDLNVWRNGMTEAHVARSAALKQYLASENFVYAHTEVPDMPGSQSHRRIVFLKDSWTVVVDQVIPKEAGRFDIISSWQMGSGVKKTPMPSRRIIAANGAGMASADIPFEQHSNTIVQGRISRELNVNEPVTLAALFFNSASPKAISKLKEGGYLISGSQAAFAGIGPHQTSELLVSADFAYIDRDRLLLEGATELVIHGTVVFHSDKPVTVFWDFPAASAKVFAPEGSNIWLDTAVKMATVSVQPGDWVTVPAAPRSDLAGSIDAVLTGQVPDLEYPDQAGKGAAKPARNWQPMWETNLTGKITAIAAADPSAEEGKGIWAASQQSGTATIARISAEGKILNTFRQTGEVLSIWPARGEKQATAFGLLVGSRDDMLRAVSDAGKELWSVKTSIHQSFIIGDQYDAPWFTNPNPPNNMTGVYSIMAGNLWGNGNEEIAIGRPCTLEFYSLNGKLKAQVPTRWGNNTALALLQSDEGFGVAPILLAGKAYTGFPHLSGTNKTYSNVSDGLYGGILPGFTDMNAWLQRGMSGLRVADINGDGKDEVVYTLSGHWNELRAYDHTGKPLWMRFFGPGKGGPTFMTALEVADLHGDGLKEIVVSTKMGWVHAFDNRGNLVWQRRFDSGITALSASGKMHMLAVGCEDGEVALLDGSGNTLASATSKGEGIQALLFTGDGLIVGNAKGQVSKFNLPIMKVH